MTDESAPTVDEQHFAIGEVLAHLQDEFPDITISKIRFLESQGLIAPERTASGYRVFYDADLRRLRWILHQQREYFLPLKVIKERLDEHGPGAPPTDEPAGDVSPAPQRAEVGGRRCARAQAQAASRRDRAALRRLRGRRRARRDGRPARPGRRALRRRAWRRAGPVRCRGDRRVRRGRRDG